MAERAYRIQVVSRMVGISEAVLRAWERRYAVVRPKRTGGGYRTYSARDVEVLRRLKRLTEEGVAIAEASRLVPTIRRELDREEARAAAAPEPDGVPWARWREDILAAAPRADQQAVEEIIDQALERAPPLAVYDELLVPVLREVGEGWHEGRLGVAEEHLVTHSVRARLLTLIHGAPLRSRRHVVCACLPAEDHEIGLLGVALRLRHAGARVTYLGPRTPAEHLGRVVRAVFPDWVALSAVGDDGADALLTQLRAIAAELPALTPVVVGGRCVELHPEVPPRAGMRAVLGPEDWGDLLT